MERKTLQGTISIGRYHSGSGESSCYIDVTDELSNITFLRLRLTPEALGEALTGLSQRPCVFEFYGDYVGKRMEIKDEWIHVIDSYGHDVKEQMLEQAPAFEVDGWTLHNSMTSKRLEPKKGKLAVTFVRWVDAD